MNKNIIAVSIGDIDGIGIEILINLWLKNKYKNFVLFTNDNIFKNYLKNKKLKIKINTINNKKNFVFRKEEFNIFTFKANNKIENSIYSINYSYENCKNNHFIGLITLPLRKDLIKNKINNFTGHTEYLQRLSKKSTSNMIFIYNKLLISTLTTHIKLQNINKYLKKNNYVADKIFSLNNTLINDFGINKPKILISGVNPHSGEKGILGNEEIRYIKPSIKKIISKGINITGPISGDSMLNNDNLKNYDCFLFIYHDQALIPFKYISKFRGVNFTGNLDIIRTSPDHGTAYDLVGKNVASYKSLLNCFKIIKKIYANRSKRE